jgi:UDPglucose--hexose-1-phosphate uridylyltransferase
MENELRRGPVTGVWVVMVKNGTPIEDILDEWERKRPLPETDMQTCQFCDGNEKETPPEILAFREGGIPNGPGWKVRVVPNKSPILQIHGEIDGKAIGIYDKLRGIGAHEIVIETPRHDRTLATMDDKEVENVLWAYRGRVNDLKRDPRFRYVLVYKNYGPLVGASIKHSHSHIVATPVTPSRIKEELQGSQNYYRRKERCVYCDIIRQEKKNGDRIILEDSHFLCFSPFASIYPFQFWIMPKAHEVFFEMNENYDLLAPMLKEILGKIVKGLRDPDYIFVIHSGPNLEAKRGRQYWQTLQDDFHWHIEIMPRVRSLTGFEIGAGFHLNPVPPEDAVAYLRGVS